MLTSLTAIILAATLIITLSIAAASFPTTTPLVTAQVTVENNYNNSSRSNVTNSLNSRTTTSTFQSIVDGIRVQVPPGWVVEDVNNTDPNVQQVEKRSGVIPLAVLCPQGETLPKISGEESVCLDGAADSVLISRYADLHSRPEFAALASENKSIITISDLLAYHIQFLEQFGSTDFRLFENVTRVVNVTDPHTNQTIATAPAKYVEMTYLYPVPQDMGGGQVYVKGETDLLVLSEDGNTGYVLVPRVSSMTPSATTEEVQEEEQVLPPEQKYILDSFELVSAAAAAD